jgi:YD repeat-containing protein
VLTYPAYDFKGNLLSLVRQFAVEATKHPDWTGSVPLEEDDNSDPVLYTTAITYDALNRPVTRTTPEGGITSHTYNKTGLLYSVDVDNVHGSGEDIVTSLVYDAKGQRQKIQYGNGTTTRYTYYPDYAAQRQ